MIFDNVRLGFAKDENGNIIMINNINESEDRGKIYYCPFCGSKVNFRAMNSKDVSPHFYHYEEKCTPESMIHFLIKNCLFGIGSKFKVMLESEKEYTCKELFVEKIYKVNDKIYKPDLTIITECGTTMYIEIKYTNNKKLEDYLDIWKALNNPVIEVDTKIVIDSESKILPMFNALWYDGKLVNIKNSEDKIYCETIGEYKNKSYNKEVSEKIKLDIEKLDWLWKDIKRYKLNEVDIEYICNLINSIEEVESRNVVVEILRKPSCNQIIKDCVEFKKVEFIKLIHPYIEKFKEIGKDFAFNIYTPNKIYDRIYKMKIDATLDEEKIYYLDMFNNNEQYELLDKIKDMLEYDSMYYKNINKICNEFEKEHVNICNNISNVKDLKLHINHHDSDNEDLNSRIDIIMSYGNYWSNRYEISLKTLSKDLFQDYKSIKPHLYNLLKENSISIPYDICFVEQLDLLTKYINEKYKYKNNYYEWKVLSCLDYNKFSIELVLNTDYINKLYCKIELVNNILYLDNNIVLENLNIENNTDIEKIKNIIIENFDKIKESVIPLDSKIEKILNILNEKYNNYNLSFHYKIFSQCNVEIKILFFDDKFTFSISDNILFKNKIKIALLRNDNLDIEINKLTTIINKNLYLDYIDFEKDNLNILVEELNRRYLNVDGIWRVYKHSENNHTIISLIDKSNVSISDFVIENNYIDDTTLKHIENKIVNTFSETIRKYKFGI